MTVVHCSEDSLHKYVHAKVCTCKSINMDICFSKSVFFSKVAGGEHVVRMGPWSDLNHLGARKQRMEQGGNDIAEKGDFAHFTQFCTFDLILHIWKWR